MFLVDTSVLINYLKGKETRGAAYLHRLIVNDIDFCITGFVYQEILQGAKTDQEFSTLKEYLAPIEIASLKYGLQSFERAAYLNFRCRRQGITVRSTIDFLIAEIAIENNLRLLHDDDDFIKISSVVDDLKLV